MFSSKSLCCCSYEKVKVVGMFIAWIIVASLVGGIVFSSSRRAFGGLLRLVGFVLLGVCLMACLLVWLSSSSIHL